MNVLFFIAGIIVAFGGYGLYRACRWLDEHGGGAL